MIRLRVLTVAALLALWARPEPAAAHHSLAAFDHTKQIVIDGVVKSFEFANPHSRMVVVEKRPDGSTAEWTLETGSPSVLFRYNITARTFAPGDRVTATIHPHRTDSKAGALMRVVKADGSTFMLEDAK